MMKPATGADIDMLESLGPSISMEADRPTISRIPNPSEFSFGSSSSDIQMNSRFAPKYLGSMPFDVTLLRTPKSLLWQSEWRTVKAKKKLFDPGLAMNVLGNKDAVRAVQPDRPSIQGSMVEDAEREAVADIVRTTMRVPSDMRGFQTEIGVAEAAVVAADGASVFVDPQDAVAKCWVPSSADWHCFPGETNRREEVVMN